MSVDSEDVESDGLGERSALSDGDDVSIVDSECWGCVGGEVLVSLLVPSVLGHELQIFSSDD